MPPLGPLSEGAVSKADWGSVPLLEEPFFFLLLHRLQCKHCKNAYQYPNYKTVIPSNHCFPAFWFSYHLCFAVLLHNDHRHPILRSARLVHNRNLQCISRLFSAFETEQDKISRNKTRVFFPMVSFLFLIFWRILHFYGHNTFLSPESLFLPPSLREVPRRGGGSVLP